MKLTAQDLAGFGVVDEIVKEPLGGAHRLPDDMIASLGLAIARALDTLDHQSPDQLRQSRRDKFLAIGKTET